MKGFKKFIMRGNIVDLAVAVAIGAAFQDLVKQFGASFINPLIKAISGGKAVSGQFKVGEAVFDWGAMVNGIIIFLITAAVIYFLIVLPYNKLRERQARKQGIPAEETDTSPDIVLLTEIRDLLAKRA